MKKKLLVSAGVLGVSVLLHSLEAIANYEGIEHQAEQDSITLTWDDEADFYEVYKDGNKVWEGSEQTYKVNNLEPDVQYNFIVASYENDELLTFEELKATTDNENTVRAFTQSDSFDDITVEHRVQIEEGVEITWDNEIPNSLDTYTVNRNGIEIGETSENLFVDDAIEPGEEYLYEIEGTVKVEEEEKNRRLNELEEEGVEVTPEIEEAVSYDNYYLNRYVKVPGLDLQQRLVEQMNFVNRFGIQYTTFIPDEYVSIAGGFVGYIGGDNRMNSAGNAIWDEFSDRYRTRSAIRADFTNNRVEADRSNSYPYIDSRGLAISVTGRYNGNKRLVEEQLAEADTFTRSNSSINSSRASWDLEHSVGIPLFMELPPNIDYTYSVNITSNGSGSVSGVHDLAPAHEVAVYIPESGMSFLVYTRDNEGFNNLFPTHGNQRFNASF